MGDGWLEPAGGPEQWRKLNKYKDGRRVLYVCDYVDLLDNDDYMSLPEPTALLLHRLWKAFARARGHLPNDTRRLSQVCGQRVTKPMVDLLLQAGFFRVSVTRPSRTRYGFGTSSSKEVEVDLPRTSVGTTSTEGAAVPTAAPPSPPKEKKPRAPDPLFEALIEELGVNQSELTSVGRGSINSALKQLRSLDPPATPEQIHGKAAAYRERYGEDRLTGPALAKHWGSLSNGRKYGRTPEEALEIWHQTHQ